MAEIIGLPKLSPTMEEGVLVKWTVNVGDSVEPGDLVAEVETDKANMDFTLEDDGVLLALLVEEGATVALGAPVAILGEEGEDISALLEQIKSGAAGGGKPAAAPTAAPAAPTAAPTVAAAPAPAPTPASTGRILASPLARTVAKELGIDLGQLAGSGPGGRIIERDVRAAAQAQPAAATALAVVEPAASTPPVAAAVAPPTDGTAYRDEPLTNMRRRIAERLTEAKRDVPHFYLTRSFDAAPLLAFRKRLNELLAGRGKVSVNDLIIKGVALSLRRHPQCNAQFVGTGIRYFDDVHVGVAVATEQGLVTPVIRNADLKGLGGIASEVRDMASRARERRLKMHEIQGSTFTISNLGMFGIEHFTAIINPPEAGILAVGTIVETPVVKDGEITVGKRMTVTMSCDHRVIDGAVGAQFLKELVSLLEQPEALAL